MIIRRDLIQGSLEWAIARAGLLTASEFGQLVTTSFDVRKGEMPRTYIASKVAEAWLGTPLDGFGSWSMDQGSLLESEALPWLELELDLPAPIERVGLCLSDDKRVACSPDGIIGGNIGIEAKCPLAKTHCGYVLAGVVPADYLPQIHFSMFVTGFAEWKFVSYRRHFPNLVLTVERDEEIQESIREAVSLFLLKFDLAMARMVELNGGPPERPKLTPMPQREEPFVSDAMDVPT